MAEHTPGECVPGGCQVWGDVKEQLASFVSQGSGRLCLFGSGEVGFGFGEGGLALAEIGEELLDGRVEGEEHGSEADGVVGAAELGEGQGSGDGDLLFEEVHFVLDVGGEAAVGLEFAEFVEGAVGAALELGGNLDDAVEGAEEGLGVGFV